MFKEKKPTTVESSSCSEFHDHSTMSGKTKIALSRIHWQHVIIASAVVGFLAFCAIVAAHWEAAYDDMGGTKENFGSLSPRWIQEDYKGTTTNEKPPGFYLTYHGNPGDNASIFQGLTQPWSKATVPIYLKVRNAVVNASQFVSTLVECEYLESIDIETTGVIGHYVPSVYLPNLKFFKYNFIGVDTSGYKFDRDPAMLNEILFFEKTKNSTWDLKTNLTNLGLNMSVTIGGKKLVQIDRDLGSIKLNLDYGWEILQNVKGPYSSLTLVSCPWSTKPLKNISLTPALTYLNLFNITRPSTSPIPIKFNELVRENLVPKLETLILYQLTLDDPGMEDRGVNLNLSIFPSTTLQKISLRGVHLSAAKSLHLWNVTDLTLDSNNYTVDLLENFDTIFAKVKTVRLFNLGGQQVSDLLLLSEVLIFPSLERLLVTHFDWTGGMDQSSKGSGSMGIGQMIRNALSAYGVVMGAPNFKIENISSGPHTASVVTEEEVNWERFLSMGFQDVESFEHYRVNL